MTHPDGRPYTAAERREIVAAARANARELLRRLELLAHLDGLADDRDAAPERTQGDGEAVGGGR